MTCLCLASGKSLCNPTPLGSQLIAWYMNIWKETKFSSQVFADAEGSSWWKSKLAKKREKLEEVEKVGEVDSSNLLVGSRQMRVVAAADPTQHPSIRFPVNLSWVRTPDPWVALAGINSFFVRNGSILLQLQHWHISRNMTCPRLPGWIGRGRWFEWNIKPRKSPFLKQWPNTEPRKLMISSLKITETTDLTL